MSNIGFASVLYNKEGNTFITFVLVSNTECKRHVLPTNSRAQLHSETCDTLSSDSPAGYILRAKMCFYTRKPRVVIKACLGFASLMGMCRSGRSEPFIGLTQ